MGLRPLGRVGILLAAVLPVAAAGCHTNSKWYRDARYTVVEAFEGTPEPAANLGVMWQKQLAHLNDPTHDGTRIAGIVGLVNLYAADGLPTRTDGDLQVMARDETPRAPGQPAAEAEMWHLDPVTLRRILRTKNDRGMDSYALFLPWPKNWTDVTKVRMQVKYTPKTGPNLTAGDQLMMFDVPNYVAGNASGGKGTPLTMAGIPSLKAVQKGLAAEANRAPAYANDPRMNGPVVPVSGEIGPVAPLPLAPSPVPAPAPMPMSMPAMNAPMPQPVPPPPPVMSAAPAAAEVFPVRPVAAASPVPPPAQAIPITPSPRSPSTTSVVVGEGLPAIDLPATR